MAKTFVKTWQEHFSREDFCRRLGFDVSDAEDLFSAYAGVGGFVFQFMRLVDGGSLQWTERRTRRSIMESLDLPAEWHGNLVRFFIFEDVEVRFVDSFWTEDKEEKPSAASVQVPSSSWFTSMRSRFRNRHQ